VGRKRRLNVGSADISAVAPPRFGEFSTTTADIAGPPRWRGGPAIVRPQISVCSEI
jgi:hypothetical protein